RFMSPRLDRQSSRGDLPGFGAIWAGPFHEPQCRAGVSPASVGNADGTEPLALPRSLGRRDACPTLGPPRFMVPMHAQKRMEAFLEPTHPQPLPGGEQTFVRVLSVPLLGGVRGGFMSGRGA